MLSVLLQILLFVTALFLILLILVQRGKGGGLAGALGGMGGQSAFGTKAGDLFTRITIAVASFWIVLCAVTVWYLGHSKDVLSSRLAPPPGVQAPAQPDGAKPAPAQPAPAQPAAGTGAADKPAGGGAETAK